MTTRARRFRTTRMLAIGAMALGAVIGSFGTHARAQTPALAVPGKLSYGVAATFAPFEYSVDGKLTGFDAGLAQLLSHYISVGVEELDQEKLTPLLRLKYRDSLADAVADLGQPEEIGQVFSGFQKYLYEQRTAA